METTRTRRIRPELILGILAAAAAVLLVAVAVLCLPYYFAEEAPELQVPQFSQQPALMETEETQPPETEPERS